MLIYNPPHGKSIRVPKAFAIRAIRVQRKNSIRVPKTFVLFELFVFKKAVHPSPTHQCWTQADHLVSYLSCPKTTISVARHDHYHYRITSLHNLLAVHNIHSMRQAADTGTCSDASAVKGRDATFLCINITAWYYQAIGQPSFVLITATCKRIHIQNVANNKLLRGFFH